MIIEKSDRFAPLDAQENLVVLMLMLPSANRKTKETSKNALTQLVGRFLRQPYARKTQVRDLDESYVFCFQQRGKQLLDGIKQGFEAEGLGDLRGHIATDDERGGPAGDGKDRLVFLIEELRKQLEAEKDRLAERVFRAMLDKDELRFLIIGNNFNWGFPKTVAVKPTAKTLTRKDGSQLESCLFEFVPEEAFNDTEKAVACYLENRHRLFFWYRNRSRHDYSIQGWREHRIYPDFIFTATDKDAGKDYERVYVVETKGLHLKDNAKTNYVRKVFDLCTRQAKSRNWTELGLEMKDKVVRFEVLAEDEWQAKLNEVLTE